MDDVTQSTKIRDPLAMLDLEDLAGEGPLERLGQDFVEVVDEVEDLGAQVFLGGEAATADDAAGQDAEPDLHLVEPRAVLGRVNKANTMAGVAEELLAALQGLQHPALALLAQRLFVNPAGLGHELDQPFGL